MPAIVPTPDGFDDGSGESIALLVVDIALPGEEVVHGEANLPFDRAAGMLLLGGSDLVVRWDRWLIEVTE